MALKKTVKDTRSFVPLLISQGWQAYIDVILYDITFYSKMLCSTADTRVLQTLYLYGCTVITQQSPGHSVFILCYFLFIFQNVLKIPCLNKNVKYKQKYNKKMPE